MEYYHGTYYKNKKHSWNITIITLWLFNIAMEHCHF